jgi:predicted nucleic acid-binding protein
MSDNVFIDTNIWVYAHIDDGKEKYTQARIFLGERLREKHIIVSTQILSEFYSAMTKKQDGQVIEKTLVIRNPFVAEN